MGASALNKQDTLRQQLATVTAERNAKLAPVVLALKRLVWDMESSPYVKARQFTGGLEQAHQAFAALDAKEEDGNLLPPGLE